MAEKSDKYKEYLALRDYLAYDPINGMIRLKANVGKSNQACIKLYGDIKERKVTYHEFLEYYDNIVNFIATSARTW